MRNSEWGGGGGGAGEEHMLAEAPEAGTSLRSEAIDKWPADQDDMGWGVR